MEKGIHILVDLKEGPTGGGNQFLKALRESWRKEGRYRETPAEAEIILFNSFPFENFRLFFALARYRAEGKTIAHRLDGPISVVRGQDRFVDHLINFTNRFFAHATIFQTEWSRDYCKRLGLPNQPAETVVINGADPRFFFPPSAPRPREGKIRLIASSWSNNWRKGFDIYQFLDENLDFSRYEMVFVGNSPLKFRNIRLVAPLPSERLGEMLRAQDIYITASRNDPCSNALVEAICCGLPSLVLDSGGHPEILRAGGKKFRGTEDVLAALEELAEGLAGYRARLPVYDIGHAAADYSKFLFALPQPAIAHSWHLWGGGYLFLAAHAWRAYTYVRQALAKRFRALGGAGGTERR